MHVVMLSKALVVGAYQKKAEELASFGDLRLTVIVPPEWAMSGHRQRLERAYTSGYELRVLPVAWNGHFHWHYYPGLWRCLRELRPDIVHADEEPYNVATAQALWCARRVGARSLFFSWQNIYRRLPPPFSLIEGYCLRSADAAIAGNRETVSVLRRKGYRRAVKVIPQFGIDPELYKPLPRAKVGRTFTIGYIGRLVEEKGLGTLVAAVLELGGDCRIEFVGDGPFRQELERLCQPLGERAVFRTSVPSTDVPDVLNELDALVLPSVTRPNWKEQFGRVLVEAMACGVPVVGSNSGEIPNVIGDAGIVFPEGDAEALRGALERLRADADYRNLLGSRGRERAMSSFSQAKIAEQTHRVYRELMADARSA